MISRALAWSRLLWVPKATSLSLEYRGEWLKFWWGDEKVVKPK